MKQYFIILSLVLFSCGGAEEKELSEEDLPFEEEENLVVETPDRGVYIDETLASEITLEFSQEDEEGNTSVFANVEKESYVVQKFEGTLMKASGHEDGFILHFEPYDFWDEDEGYLVESGYDFAVDIVLTKDQNDALGFVDYTKATRNLAWDYFENLFIIYFYDDDNELRPLKFENLGKTEWDG